MSEAIKIIKYSDYYQDVCFEIHQIFTPYLKTVYYIDDFYWTYYIFIELEKIPKKYNPNSFWLTGEPYMDSILYKYYDHTTLNNIYFYSGISFYSKVRGLEQGEKKIIKVGCDFHHAWDVERGYAYPYEDVYEHVTETIHSLFDEMPEYGVKS